MSGMVSPVVALLTGLFVQSLLFGISVALSIDALYVLLRLKTGSKPNWLLVFAAASILIMTTIDMAFSFYYVLQAFLILDANPEGFYEYIGNFATWTNVSRVGLAVGEAMLGDFVLVYRTWVVWGKRKQAYLVIIVPVILWTTCTALVVVLLLHLARGKYESAFVGDPQQWVVSTLTITLAQNVLCIGLIVYKLWTVISTDGVKQQTSATLWRVVSVIVECGVLYFLTILAFMIVYLVDESAFIIVEDIGSPLISIAFSLLLVRVGLRRRNSSPGSKRNISMSTRQMMESTVMLEITIVEPDETEQSDMEKAQANWSEAQDTVSYIGSSSNVSGEHRSSLQDQITNDEEDTQHELGMKCSADGL
ncbi:hypothetical protein CALCODRAFT_117323 [Calocera cornea HHB12733]|uniref:Uncharacterized protein n=1 Tax=Calocera cornea HHB12733 TaxID=1353952 RepID=A0A165ICG1_9BASI|nr:hypothetical protein CALCODRAFT_117323 [Calocera cornea HHB12733]